MSEDSRNAVGKLQQEYDLAFATDSFKIVIRRATKTSKNIARAHWRLGRFFTRQSEFPIKFGGLNVGAVKGCAVCKKLIEQERIENDPETQICQTHADEITKYGGEFKPRATDERTSKSTSMKINYGSVSVERVRNQEAVNRLREDYLNKQSH